jgi:hypothetical protein
MTKQEAKAFADGLAGWPVADLNALNEKLEAEKQSVKERQRVLVGVRATAIRAERMKEAEASIDRQGMRPPAQRRTANVAQASGTASLR